MLSAGTRIGPFQVKNWIKEGSCGQSYQGEASAGDEKGKIRYLKLFHRDISEKEGFSDYFSQECKAIQQINGRGIWPILGNGIMKWKHWIAYGWFEGEVKMIEPEEEGEDVREIHLISLRDWVEYDPSLIGPTELKSILIDLHCGLHAAHESGVIHGNIKPSNVLIRQNQEGSFDGWVTEFALPKICQFEPLSDEEKDRSPFSSQSLQFQDSLKESQRFRPDGVLASAIPEESWDIYGLGAVVQWVINQSTRPTSEWVEWQAWSDHAVSESFGSISLSMEALPGVENIVEYGIKGGNTPKENDASLEEIRKQRELEWNRKQKVSSATFRRNITALIGCLCLFIFFCSKVYLFFNPSPWVEYSLEGVSDHYQLGFGFSSGKAWGILPPTYDEAGKGGQDVAGEWTRENGVFRLDFRKFKKINEEESGKKLWQFIGKGSTSPSDYYSWSDYLSYDRRNNRLNMIKRVHEDEVFVPGVKKDGVTSLFPEIRVRRGGGVIKKTELFFSHDQNDNPDWAIFIGVGFLLSSLLYHRMILKTPDL